MQKKGKVCHDLLLCLHFFLLLFFASGYGGRILRYYYVKRLMHRRVGLLMRMKILGISLSTRAAVVVAVALIVCSGTLFVANLTANLATGQRPANFSDIIFNSAPMTPVSLNVDSTMFWVTLVAANMRLPNGLNAAQTAVVNAENAYATAQASLSVFLAPAEPESAGNADDDELSDDSPPYATPTSMSNPLDQTRVVLELNQTRVALMGTEQALMMTQQAIDGAGATRIASNDIPTPVTPQSSTMQNIAAPAAVNPPLDINVLLNGVSVLMGAFGVLIGLRALRVESRYRQMVVADASAVNKPKRRPSDSSSDDIDTEIN